MNSANSSTCLQEPRKEYSPTRGLGSGLVSLVPYLGDALGVVGIKKVRTLVELEFSYASLFGNMGVPIFRAQAKKYKNQEVLFRHTISSDDVFKQDGHLTKLSRFQTFIKP